MQPLPAFLVLAGLTDLFVSSCEIALLCFTLSLLSLSTLEHLKRWLQPDKVAINTEEVQYLIPPESQAEKQETEEPPAAEQ